MRDSQWALPSDSAIDFIDNRLDGSLHEAFANPNVVYSHFEDQYILDMEKADDISLRPSEGRSMTHLTSNMEEQVKAFTESMRLYEEKKTGWSRNPRNNDSSRTRVHTWGDVMGAMRSAGPEQKSKEKGVTSKISSVLLAFSKASPAIISFLGCLPNDTFGASSVLCGGLTIVFQVSIRMVPGKFGTTNS